MTSRFEASLFTRLLPEQNLFHPMFTDFTKKNLRYGGRRIAAPPTDARAGVPTGSLFLLPIAYCLLPISYCLFPVP